MQIQWREPNKAIRAAAASCLDELLPPDTMPAHDNFDYRVAELAFYPDLVFIECTDLGDQNVKSTSPSDVEAIAPASLRRLYVLVDPEADRATALDMTNTPVYRINRDYLRLNESNAIAYVAFFFSCVAGPYGLMPVIERLDAPEGADEEADEALGALEGYIPPSLRPPEEDGPLKVQAGLLFQGAVFKAVIEVTQEGHIKVTEHELALASGPPEDEAQDVDPEEGDHT